MSETDTPSRLVWLRDTYRPLPDPSRDVRGRTAMDCEGTWIGSVEDLMVDEVDERVRYLRIGLGGFLGFGRKEVVVPVEAVIPAGGDILIIRRDRFRPDVVASGDEVRDELGPGTTVESTRRVEYSGVPRTS